LLGLVLPLAEPLLTLEPALEALSGLVAVLPLRMWGLALVWTLRAPLLVRRLLALEVLHL
jgi:hypothetical protein